MEGELVFFSSFPAARLFHPDCHAKKKLRGSGTAATAHNKAAAPSCVAHSTPSSKKRIFLQRNFPVLEETLRNDCRAQIKGPLPPSLGGSLGPAPTKGVRTGKWGGGTACRHPPPLRYGGGHASVLLRKTKNNRANTDSPHAPFISAAVSVARRARLNNSPGQRGRSRRRQRRRRRSRGSRGRRGTRCRPPAPAGRTAPPLPRREGRRCRRVRRCRCRRDCRCCSLAPPPPFPLLLRRKSS